MRRDGGGAPHGGVVVRDGLGWLKARFGRRQDVFGFRIGGDGFVWELGAEGLETVEILDGAAVEALGLGLIAEEELPGIGLAVQSVEADGEAEAAVLGAGDLDIADELIVEEVVRSAMGGDGLIQGRGEETGLQTSATEEGELG